MRTLILKLTAVAWLVTMAVPTRAQAPAWDPQPWLADLGELRTALETKYANLEYLLTEREFDLAGLFMRAETAIRGASGDSEAVAVFNRLIQRLGDGHVGLSWPRTPAPRAGAPGEPPAAQTAETFCRARGYGPSSPGFARALTGYSPIESGDLLHAGAFTVGGTRYGMVRVSAFHPQISLAHCTESVAELRIPPGEPCDESCEDRLITRAYQRLTAAFEDRITRLKAAGAEVLIIDITGNGGGSEWVEAAARMLTSRRLTSARLGVVRGPHWTRILGRRVDQLRGFAENATGEERRRLLAWAAEAETMKAEAERSCPPTGGCPWLARAGYATGLIGTLRAGEFAGKPWAPWVFIAAQYPYRDGVWDGPLIVLTDGEAWSAAEQFAALLQDNRAALIVGGRTGGSGCGHSWGGTPTTLTHSRAVLSVPDCARFRADGSNEVRGIIPDLLLPWRSTDGPTFRARILEAALPEAAERARALHRAGAAR